MATESYKYTIIIPHHDCMDLLQRGLNSIPQRKDIQIIVIDDASETISKNSWNEFKERNKRVVFLFNKENKGPGVARNRALDGHVKGQWLLFLDADDTFEPNAFDRFDVFANGNYDLIYFNVNKIFPDGTKMKHDRLTKLIAKALSDKMEIDRLKYLLTAPWNKMIRSSIVLDNNIRFDPFYYGEDVVFSVIVGYVCQRVLVSDNTLYNYSYNESGLAHLFLGRNMKWLMSDYKRREAFHRFLVFANHRQWERHHFVGYLYDIKKCLVQGKITQGVRSCIALICVFINPLINKNYIVDKINSIRNKQCGRY